MFTFNQFRRSVLGIKPQVVSALFSQLHCDRQVTKERLRVISCVFIHSYNTTLEVGPSAELVSMMHGIDPELRGFAFEGVGMAMAMMDYFTPWNRHRLREVIANHPRYAAFIHVGVGFAMANLPGGTEAFLQRMRPADRWWAIDGCGFFHGLFRWQRTVPQQLVPRQIAGYGLQAFDQGLGRSLWFALNAEPAAVPSVVARFPARRQAELWSGLGLASTYAGGVAEDAIAYLRTAAGHYQGRLVEGSAIATWMRYQAGNITDHTERVCGVLCGMSAESVGRLVEGVHREIVWSPAESHSEEQPAYAMWRQTLAQRLQAGSN